jgi:hypothetical protein
MLVCAGRRWQRPIGLGYNLKGWPDDKKVGPAFSKIGAVAQLGERLICTQEVAGSIPTSSTSFLMLGL